MLLMPHRSRMEGKAYSCEVYNTHPFEVIGRVGDQPRAWRCARSDKTFTTQIAGGMRSLRLRVPMDYTSMMIVSTRRITMVPIAPAGSAGEQRDRNRKEARE